MPGKSLYTREQIRFCLAGLLARRTPAEVTAAYQLRFGRALGHNQLKYVRARYGFDPDYNTCMVNRWLPVEGDEFDTPPCEDPTPPPEAIPPPPSAAPVPAPELAPSPTAPAVRIAYPAADMPCCPSCGGPVAVAPLPLSLSSSALYPSPVVYQWCRQLPPPPPQGQPQGQGHFFPASWSD